MKVLQVKTNKKEEMIDLTSQVKKAVQNSGVTKGTCFVYVPHTTAAVTINENADPSVQSDILMTLKNTVPDSLPYTHSEGNSPGHVKSSLIGPSVTVLIEDNNVVLGTWQGIFFCEFDGPRNRKAYIEIHPHPSS